MALIDAEENKKEIEYPVLRKIVGGGYIVCFTSSNVGTVIESTDSCYAMGYHSDTWSCCDQRDWTPVTKLIKG